MKYKLPFIIISVSLIVLISATVLTINNIEQSQPQVIDMNQIINIKPFGRLKQVELNKLEYQEGRTAYNDNKYHYLINSDGSLNGMFLINNYSDTGKKIELDKDSSILISKDFIKTLIPNFNISQYQIQFNKNEANVSSLYYYFVDENSTQYGAIVISFNEYGEISSLCSDLMANKVNSTANDMNNLSEDRAIDLAYDTVDNWINTQKQNKKSNLINPNDDPKAMELEIITNEPEFIENIEYDISNKSSHIIKTTSYFDKNENKLCWLVKIDGIKRTINKWENNCSFLVNIDAETREVFNIDKSR